MGRLLDGTLVVRRLVSALHNGTGQGRGLHTGEFQWAGDGVRVAGHLSGMTNVGTHRPPVFGPARDARPATWKAGCAAHRPGQGPALVGCQVTAAYRLLFDPSEGFQDTGIQGTLEGLVVLLRPASASTSPGSRWGPTPTPGRSAGTCSTWSISTVTPPRRRTSSPLGFTA